MNDLIERQVKIKKQMIKISLNSVYGVFGTNILPPLNRKKYYEPDKVGFIYLDTESRHVPEQLKGEAQ